MESWSCTSEGKGFVPDETISHTDSLARNRSALMGCDLKIPCTFESQGFGELGLPEVLGRHLPRSTTSMGSLNPFFGEDKSSSKLSSSIVESNSRDSSLFDLKLDAYTSKSSKGASFFSSSASSTPTKRMKISGVYSQIAYCQVHGCNKDLSSSKDYHKRHKVCEAHSKTAKVIVKGIEQRFCQQCSRFHLLAEFDDGKRSCRKRLAGHNERRRKPQVSIHSGRDGRLLESYNGSRFPGTMFTAESFVCQDIRPSSILDAENYRTSDWCRRIKVECGPQHRPLSGVPVTNGQMHFKPVFTSYDIGKQYPPAHVNGTNNLPIGSILSETGSQNRHYMRSLNSGSRSIDHEGALGAEEFNDFHTTASTVQELSRIADSGCALSLLSFQSQNSTSYASGIPIACPLVMPVSHTHYNLSKVSDKLCSHGSTSGVSNKCPPSGPITISNGSDADDSGTNEIFQGSQLLNTKDRLSCDGGTTIDLLQLSTELQRVEDQWQSLQVKQENDALCRLQSPYHVK